MENTNNSYSRDQYSVSTNILTMWDKSSRQLRISGSNDNLSISIWCPVVDNAGVRRYPIEQRHTAQLSLTNVSALENILFAPDKLLAAFAEGVDAKFSIFTNNARTTILEIELLNGEFSLNLYRNCDSTTRISNNSISYTFNTIIIGEGYNPSTGEMTTSKVQSDYTMFAKAVQCYRDMLGGGITGHGNKVVGSYQTKEFTKYLTAIATALNAQIPVNPGYGSNRGYSQPSYNSESSSGAVNVPNQQFNEVTNLNDMI